MDIRGDLEQSMNEEAAASHAYRMRANYAYAVGDRVSAGLWSHIADEEDSHYKEFQERLNAVPAGHEMREHTEKMEEALGHRHPGQEGTGRFVQVGKYSKPFPRTEQAWEDLGFDIEAKLPARIGGLDVDRQTVRDAVATAIGKREGYPEDAKRWLVQTAGELGIR